MLLGSATLLLGVVGAAATAQQFKGNYYGCTDAASKAEKYCDKTLSDSERVDDIVAKLNLTEKIAFGSPTKSPFCACHTAPTAGLPDYKWLTETNSCVDSPCHPNAKGKCATIFVGPNNMAASFNRSSWRAKGDVVSTDLRAFNNIGDAMLDAKKNHGLGVGIGTDEYGLLGLSGYGPNINVVKDPRYGRNSELPGEDPVLTAQYAVNYVQGMQQIKVGKGGKPVLKMLSSLKHYTAYSVETSRFTFSANLSDYTLHDSNLPQYEAAFMQGNASGAMCSYFAPNGISSCGNEYLLNDRIRSAWKRPDAVVMSDCSAVANMMKNVMKLDQQHASAQAMNAGLDIYGGWNDNLWGQGYLAKAVAAGLTKESAITESVHRTFMQKMKVGLFDPPEDSPWTNIGLEDLNTTYSQGVAYEAALQGMVLLKNEPSALPLKPGIKLAVVGPMGNTVQLLFSDYETAGFDNTDTIFTHLAAMNTGGTTSYEQGTTITGPADNITTATAAVAAADATILAIGLDKSQEHEGMDRKDTLLPAGQEALAAAVFKAAGSSKPVIVLLCNGGAVSIDDLITPASAIIEAFNPAQQGPKALSALIFGKENRWGKLPITIYDKDYSKKLPIQDMEYHTPPGRSYRYYTGKPLFSFGDGLSLTTFSHTCKCDDTTLHDSDITCSCDVKNTGKMAGDEVVMVYDALSQAVRSAVGDSHPVPIKRLVDFERTAIAAGGSATVQFTIPKQSLAITTADGSKKLYSGEHELVFSRGNGNDNSVKVTV